MASGNCACAQLHQLHSGFVSSSNSLLEGQLEFKENRSGNEKQEQERELVKIVVIHWILCQWCSQNCVNLATSTRSSVYHTISTSPHKTVYWLMPFAICYNFTILLAYLTPHEYMLIHTARCFTIWLNLLNFSV